MYLHWRGSLARFKNRRNSPPIGGPDDLGAEIHLTEAEDLHLRAVPWNTKGVGSVLVHSPGGL